MMNNEITIFENPEFGKVRTFVSEFGKVRTFIVDGEPWFVASDVCKALEIGNPSQALTRLDDDEKKTTLISNDSAATGKSYMSFVNEPGLYTLVLGSRNKEAKQFKRWIAHEVIPSIRKHGMYAADELLDNPDLMIRIITELKEEREMRKLAQAETVRLEKENAKMLPKVQFADAVSASKTSILVGEMAKILKQNGVNMGQNRFFDWLRGNGYLMQNGSSKNLPTQKSMEMGLFEIKESTQVLSDGSVRINKTPKILPKGQIYFVNKFLGKK